MIFPRQEYWSRLPFPSLGDLPDPGIESMSHVSCIGRWVLYQLSHQGRPEVWLPRSKQVAVKKTWSGIPWLHCAVLVPSQGTKIPHATGQNKIKEGRKKTWSNQRSSTTHYQCLKRIEVQGFPSGSVVKNLPVNAGDAGLIPGLGRSRREGNGNLLQYSCLENPTDRGAW